MNRINVAGGLLEVPEVGLGCMRIADMEVANVRNLIDTAMEVGIDFFDHADIYGNGKSEEVFSKALSENKSLREKMIIQSKCGIVRQGYFDFSKGHILNSVDGILSRLEMDYIDVLLLHRPDALVEPEEVAEAFDELERSGKVRHFGVSNQNPMQIELLKKSLKQPLIFNQLQLSIMRTGMIDSGFNVNMKVANSVDHDGQVLEYSRINDITIQAWSPFQYGFFEGVFLNHDKFPELNKVIDTIAEKYDVTNSAVAVAWIARHPGRIQTIIGTTNQQRVKDIARISEFSLTRQEWYEIYRAAGNKLP